MSRTIRNANAPKKSKRRRPAAPSPTAEAPVTQETTPETDAASSRSSTSRARLWGFRVVAAVFLPVLMLVLLEGIFTLLGVGDDTSPTKACTVKGKATVCDNPKFGWQFFPKNISRELGAFAIPAEKPKGTVRIFVLGASAAKGTPDIAFSVGRVLEVMLKARYPAIPFEVVTLAAPAINSHAVRRLARAAGALSPDLFVIYLGNNEVVGPYGAGTVFSPLTKSLPIIRMGIAFKETRIGQLMSRAFGALQDETTRKGWRGMEMFLDKQVRTSDPALESVYHHFRANLDDIVDAGLDAGAGVILSTIAVNLKDNPPFGSLHRENLDALSLKKWETHYNEGIRNETGKAYAAALTEYRAAADIDNTFADLAFRMGTVYNAQGVYQTAEDRFVQAKELDTLRFRADRRINQIIRETAGAHPGRVSLLDAEEVFEAACPHGITDGSLFHEHVHFNFDGAYLLARQLLTSVENALPEAVRGKRARDVEVPDQAFCEARLAYTDWDRLKLASGVLHQFIEKPPFTHQLYHDARVADLKARIARHKAALTPEAVGRVAEQYEAAIAARPDDWRLKFKLGSLYAENHPDKSIAARLFREVIRDAPNTWLGYNGLGTVLLATGKPKGAIAELQEALERKPNAWEALLLLGNAYYQSGDADNAASTYRALIDMRSDAEPAYEKLAALQIKRGASDQALETLLLGSRNLPNSAAIHLALGKQFLALHRLGAARDALETARRLDPSSAEIRDALAQAQQQTQR